MPAGTSVSSTVGLNAQSITLAGSPVSNGFYSWYTPAISYSVNTTTGVPFATGSTPGTQTAINLTPTQPATGMTGLFANGTNQGSVLLGDWQDFATGVSSTTGYYGSYSSATASSNPVFWSYYNAATPNTSFNLTATITTVTVYPGLQYDFSTDTTVNTPLGPTNYVGNSGMYYFSTGAGNSNFANGPFYQDSRTRLLDITDGSSNTILFGESLGGPDNAAPIYVLTWMGAGTMPSYWDCQTPSQYFMFSSQHTGRVNFAFCDGSVRTVAKIPANQASPDTFNNAPAASSPQSPRWQAFQYLAGISDSEHAQ